LAPTKAALRRQKQATSLPIPRGSTSGLHADTAAEWRSWWAGGWASRWTEPQRHEAKALRDLIDMRNRSDDPSEVMRLTAVIRAGKKLLDLNGPSPLPETPEPKVVATPRPDPR
jgi:hypothetical protein